MARKVFSFLATSVDGYYGNLAGDVGWQTFGPEFADLSVELLDDVDTLLLGATTYREMAAYWTSDLGTGFDPRIAERMNGHRKLVVTSAEDIVAWGDSRIVTLDEVAAFKAAPGKDIAVLGSPALASGLLAAGLLDEVRVLVNPVVLGDGRKAFTAAPTVTLERRQVRPFDSGNVLLTYAPADASPMNVP